MTKIAIIQPYFLPYIGYFQLMMSVDKFVILDDVHFKRRSWLNRNNFLINSKSKLITVPLQKASQNKKINELYLYPNFDWRNQLCRTLEFAYKKSECFEAVFNSFTKILLDPNINKLNELNLKLLYWIIGYADIKCEIIESSTLYNNQALKGTERIIDICKKETADVYINLPGGRILYDKKTFKSAGISLCFTDFNFKRYDQKSSEFIPSLSIFDLIMNVPRESLSSYLTPIISSA